MNIFAGTPSIFPPLRGSGTSRPRCHLLTSLEATGASFSPCGAPTLASPVVGRAPPFFPCGRRCRGEAETDEGCRREGVLYETRWRQAGTPLIRPRHRCARLGHLLPQGEKAGVSWQGVKERRCGKGRREGVTGVA